MTSKSSNKPLIPLDNREVLSLCAKEPDSRHRTSEVCRICGYSGEHELQHLHEYPSSSLSAWAVTICVICTFINCILALPDFNPSLFDPIFSATRQQFNLLHYSSSPTRPHGDDIQFSKFLTPGTILSYPSFIAQIDAGKQSDIDFNELASSNSRRIKITSMTSTIVQFDAVDFGIEHCELKFRFEFDDGHLVASADQAFSIAIYQLNTSASLGIPLIASTPPERRNLIDTVQVTAGTSIDWHDLFSCSWGEILTFEIACCEAKGASSNCSMEWWQRLNEEDPNKAIFMLQRPNH